MKSKDCPINETANLDKIIRAIENRINQFADKYKNNYISYLRTNSTSKVIKAKCYDCVTEDLHDAIEDCRGFSCPLYFVRPYQFDDTEKVKEQVREHFKTYLGIEFDGLGV